MVAILNVQKTCRESESKLVAESCLEVYFCPLFRPYKVKCKALGIHELLLPKTVKPRLVPSRKRFSSAEEPVLF